MELATAYISILPSTSGLGKEVKKYLGDVEQKSEETGKESGNRFTKAFGKWAKRGALVAGAAVGATVGAALVGGVKSAIDQQQGQLVLSGLYGDAEKAALTLQGLKDVASKSPIEFGSYQEAASSLAYAGVEGEQAIGVLENVGKAITASGGDSSNMNSATDAVLKMVNAGKVQLDTLQQLSNAGVPILSGLAEHLGVPMETVNKMASAGEIALEDVISVMENATGGTFKSMLSASDAATESFSNQWKILKDNVSVALGEVMLPLIEELTPMIGPLGDALVGVVEKIPGFIDGLKDGVGWVRDNGIWLSTLAASLTAAGVAAWIASGGLTAAGLAIKGVFLSISAGIRAIPVIGWIIAGIGLLVTGLVYFFTKTETGQKIWAKVWGAIKTAAAAVWDWIKDVLWPGILIAWDAIATGAVWMYENAIKPAWDGIKKAALAVWDWISGTLWPGIVGAWEAISGGATSMYEGGIKPAWNAIKGAIDAVWQWLSGTLWPGITGVWDAIGAGVDVLRDWVKSAWDGIKAAVKPVVDWFQTWVWPVIEMVIELTKIAFSGMRDAIGAAWRFVKDRVIAPVVNWFQNTAWPLIRTVIDAVKLAFNVMRDSLKAAWQFVKDRVIQPVVSWFQNTAWPLLRTVIDSVKRAFNTMRDSLKAAWAFVKNNVINPVVTWFRDTAWPMLSRVIDSVKTGFNRLRDSLRDAWAFIKNNVINPVATWFRDTVKPLFDTATDKIGSAFDTLKDTVGKAWDGIKDKAKEPIRFVVDTVINSALIGNFNKLAKKLGTSTLPSVSLPSGFARGGVLPGRSRMRDGDDQLVPMRRGEGVLVSEGLRTRADRAAFLAANAAGRRGIGFASLMQGGFAGGGIWDGIKGGASKAWQGTKNVAGKAKDLAGDALDKVLDGVDFVAEALKDPASIFRKVYNAVVGKIPTAGLMTEAAKGAGSKLLTGIIDKAKGIIAPSFEMPDLSAVKAGGSLAMARTLAASFGLTMTSYKRGGARTAGSGAVSLHALGRAMDFSNSTGPTPQMMAFFNAMHQFKPTELLYSPAGARQWRRSGRMADTTGATKRMHYNHVHVGFANGGILGKPFLHDRGGWHNPGELSVNQTRKPEAVLTNGQWQIMSSLAEQNLATGGGGIQIGTVQGYTAEEVAREITREQRKRDSLYVR